VLGEFHIRKVPSRRTGGAYSLFEVATPPGSGPPHVQHREAEAFYVLEGEFEFLNGEEVPRARTLSSTCRRAPCTPTRTPEKASTGC
jgi:quercetin dioxygenase-like cupin family protein